MDQKALKTIRYTNKCTGEYKESHSLVDLQFDDNGYLFWNRKSNVKTFIEYPLPDCFTWAERGRIHELKHYILKCNQFLVYKSGNTIKPLGTLELKNIFGMSNRQTSSLIRKMKDNKIIKEIIFDGCTYFVFNPLYGFKERRLSLNVYMFFQSELKNILPKWVIDRFSGYAVELKPIFKIVK
jgi:hypothetical protein